MIEKEISSIQIFHCVPFITTEPKGDPLGEWPAGMVSQMANKYSGAVMLLLLSVSVNHSSYAAAKFADGAFTFDQAQVV